MTTSRWDSYWDLAEAKALIEMMWPEFKLHGYYLGLTGSVLWRGFSHKDLDLIVYPADSGRTESMIFEERVDVAYLLQRFGFVRRVSADDVRAVWRQLGSGDQKHVEVWTYNDRRVDVFCLR